MKTTFRLAAAAASLLLVTGCTSSLRSKDRTMREPVQMPGAPSLGTAPANSSVPSPTGSNASQYPMVPPSRSVGSN